MTEFVDFLFDKAIRIQFFLYGLEQKYAKLKKYVPHVYIITILGSCILLFLHRTYYYIILFVGLGFCCFESIVGWRNSVREFLKTCLFYNIILSAILTCIFQEIISNSAIDFVFLLLFLIIWSLVSVIAHSKVSLLSNEIVSGLAATIFTIVTCLLNMARNNTSPLVSCGGLRKQTFDWIEAISYSLLPIIGISAFCVVIVKIKIYWMDKNNKSEPE